MEILQATDLRVAAEGAKIGLTEVQRGLFPMAGTTVRLPRQIAFTKAMEIMLLGDPISAAEAERMGLVGFVVPDGQALAKARELAERLAANGPLAVQGIKAAVWAAAELPEAEAFVEEMEIGMGVMASEDAEGGASGLPGEAPGQLPGPLTPPPKCSAPPRSTASASGAWSSQCLVVGPCAQRARRDRGQP